MIVDKPLFSYLVLDNEYSIFFSITKIFELKFSILDLEYFQSIM